MELTGKKRKELSNLQTAVDTKRAAWLAAYETEKLLKGGTVTLNGTLKTLWDELTSLRAQRNALLSQYRSEGYNI